MLSLVVVVDAAAGGVVVAGCGVAVVVGVGVSGDVVVCRWCWC